MICAENCAPRHSRRKAPDEAIAAAKAKIPAADTLKLVTIDGFFVPELSSDLAVAPGVTLTVYHASSGGPDKMAGASDPLLDLNAAFAPHGFVLDIAAGAKIDRTIEILSFPGVDPACGRFGRGIIALRRGAKAR